MDTLLPFKQSYCRSHILCSDGGINFTEHWIEKETVFCPCESQSIEYIFQLLLYSGQQCFFAKYGEHKRNHSLGDTLYCAEVHCVHFLKLLS